MVALDRLLGGDLRFVAAAAVFLLGIALGLVVGWAGKRLLTALDVPESVEGTSFERTAQSLGTSTVALTARIASWTVYGVALLVALHIANLLDTQLFWIRVTSFIPNLVVALVVLGIGFVVGDKAELSAGEALRGVKLPEIGFIPRMVKYSVVFIAALVALGQVGVANDALVVLLAAYCLAIIVFGAVATKDLLAAGSAGIYLLLRQPYSIGDQVEIGDRRGIVQEVNVLVTRVEDDGYEYIIPNHLVMDEGAVLIRS